MVHVVKSCSKLFLGGWEGREDVVQVPGIEPKDPSSFLFSFLLLSHKVSDLPCSATIK
jgi:hypothetical protein